ncbi:MAG TPA: hypothetical protein VMY37_00245 [Thermoguttaceae bacterium]|nr:hypothetical protein [Thermoguttaceae bacterium]
MAELRINGLVVRTVEVWRTAWPSESGREPDRALLYLAPEEAQDAGIALAKPQDCIVELDGEQEVVATIRAWRSAGKAGRIACVLIAPRLFLHDLQRAYGWEPAPRTVATDRPETDVLEETILQFGTGKFLRCFADLFVHEANQDGRAPGRVVVLQSTGFERARAFNQQGGRYHVAIRGLDAGQRVDRTVEVRSVSRALAAATDWDEVIAVARSESLRAIVSNTTEAGYALHPEDAPDDAPPRSFPAKLLCVLKVRFEAGLPPVAILPCELLEQNGTRLVGLLVEQLVRWGFSSDLRVWIEAGCLVPNTLVDRIVAAPSPGDPLAESDPLFAVAEPFALWLMDRSPDMPGLLEHPAVRVVEDLEPFHLRKVRILNGAHTALVAKARPLGLETVRGAVEDERVRPWLESLLFDEIVPTLEGRTEEPEQFARDVLERFANPFLEHRLADIALHHDVKLQTRLVPTLNEYRERFGRTPTRLSEILS